EDADNATRWRHIKSNFSRMLPKGEYRSHRRTQKQERGIWQRRYWEHLIRDEVDLQRHVDYIHFNPVKHGHVPRAVDWKYSSIHRAIRNGQISAEWEGSARDGDCHEMGEAEDCSNGGD